MKMHFAYGLFLILFCSVFYYSWLPNPSFNTENYMPDWLVAFTNEYINFRTAVPLIFLGIVGTFFFFNRPLVYKHYIAFILLLSLSIMLAELGQLLIPDRHFDWMDIFWGNIGLLTGCFLGLFLKFVLKS